MMWAAGELLPPGGGGVVGRGCVAGCLVCAAGWAAGAWHRGVHGEWRGC